MSSGSFSDKTVEPADALFCKAVGPIYKYWPEKTKFVLYDSSGRTLPNRFCPWKCEKTG
jgi:hypothetical protein